MDKSQVQFLQVVSVGCGIDVHQNLLVATVRQNDTDYETQSFDGYTSSLIALRDWCKSKGVTHVAMEVRASIGSRCSIY